MEGLDKELLKKLRDAERNAPPDYPNWKRGIGCGVFMLLLCILFFAVIAAVFPAARKWGIAVPLSVIFTLIAAAFAAFRPQK